MRKQKNIITLLVGLLTVVSAWAQPCLDGWKYRTEINVDNTGMLYDLPNHQVKLVINTQDLTSAGKINPDGSDIRFLDAGGTQLNYWIENNTFNTSSTNIWIKVGSIAGGVTSSIYMFYGNSTAPAMSNGDNTFVLFDDFLGTSIDPSKWNACGSSSVTVAGGIANFSSTNSPANAIIQSQNQYADTLVSEMYVNNVSNGIAFIGQNDVNHNGWAIAFENVASNTLMKLMSQGDDAAECRTITNQSPSINSVSAGATQGIWSLTWYEANKQHFQWPGGSESRSDILHAPIFSSNKQITVGCMTNAGSMNIDWVRVRQYAAIQPVLSLGTELELINDLSATNSGGYCEGNSLELYSSFYAGATYSWVGPNAFTSTDQNPIITGATTGMAGTYVVTVTVPSGCSPVSASTDVAVASASIGGNIVGSTTVCKGSNSGTLTLSGETGSILYWETATSSGGPWSTITNTTNSIDYTDVVSTTYYRAIVQNGACVKDTSSVATISIDEKSAGGNIIGAMGICEGDNSGSLNLINIVGSVTKWQSSIDNGSTWTDITNNTLLQNYTNLTQTTLYRAEVVNGVCAATLSDEIEMTVAPKPLATFSSTEVCKGLNTQYANTSTVTSGSITENFWDFGDGSGDVVKNPSHLFGSSGTYSVLLSVTSSNGCVDSVRQNVIVAPLPNVAFSQTNVCDSVSMDFVNQSSIGSGTIAKYTWNFGDGTGAYSPVDTSYMYPGDGTYTVSLIAESDKGCVDSIHKDITIYPRATVDFIADSVCLGNTIYFINTSQTTSSSINYVWNFGDGGISNLLNPNYTYTNAGTYTVTLFANVPGGCVDTKQHTVVIYPDPIADFTFVHDCEYDSIYFNNTSTVNSGSISYLWDFGDGVTSNLEEGIHLYATDGLYTVSLDVISAYGCESLKTATVEVYPAPIANFTYSNVCNNQPTPFINTSSIPTGTMTYNWNFGDGQSDVLEDPQHVYADNGSYNVELITISDNNCSDTIIKTITVHALPETNFSASVACDGAPTVFTNTTTIDAGTVADYTWDFDDGTNSIVVDPVHQYLNPGAYNVILTASSDQLCIKDTTITVYVSDFPVANFFVDNQCLGTQISLVNTSTVANGSLSYNWDFGDGIGTSTQTDPNYLYNAAGTYSIKLVATSNLGCVDSVSKFVQIYPLPIVNAGLDTSVSQGFEVQLNGYSYGAQSFIWIPTDGLDDNSIYNPLASPEETTTYTLLVIDVNDCKNKDSVVIEVIQDYKLFVNNVITPNGNGENDTWVIGNIETFQNATVYVYDRWGYEVYSQKGYNNDWDGTSQQDQLPDGTYYYLITIEGTDITYKGALTILRNK